MERLMRDIEKTLHELDMQSALNGKTVLITGATGMIASYVAMVLIRWSMLEEKSGCSVILQVRDKKKAEHIFSNLLKNECVRLEIGDVTEWETEQKIDYIIHAASPASPQIFTTQPVQTLEANIIGTYRLLEYARTNKVKGFVLLSSGDVYGQVDDGEIIRETSVGKVDQLNMRNSYAEGKRAAEALCRAYYEQYGVPTKIARLSHTYGPGMNFESDRRVFCEFTKNILNRENICMKSDGSAVRPFCYISDAVAGIMTILFRGESGEAYNLCNDECNVSIKELADILVNLYPEYGLKVVCQMRAADDDYKESLVKKPCFTDNSKLRSLGWAPKVSIEEGFRRVITCLESKGEK